MKIIYFIDRANLNGSELHLIDILKKFIDNHELLVVSLNFGKLNDKISKLGVDQVILDVSWIYFLFSIHRTLKIVKKFKPDIIHSHQPKAILYGSLIGRILNIPSLVTIHSSPVAQALPYKNIKKYVVFIFHFAIDYLSQMLANKVIFVSISMLNKAFFPSKSKLIYNWVSSRFRAENACIRNSLPCHDINLLSVGTISYSKGFDLLIDFMNHIQNDPRSCKLNIKLNIVGEGDKEYILKLTKKCKDYGLTNINFLGYKSDLKDIYLNSSMFILLSRTETFGLVYAEAMFFGLPIFSLDLDSLCEIIPNCNSLNSDLSKHKDYFFRLINSDQMYHEVSLINFDHAKNHFDYKKNINELLFFYKSIIRIRNNNG